jgi:dTMP kinase
MADWLQLLAGKFIVFDGPDGSGKTTQFARFAAHCRQGGLAVCEVREPGGTSIGEQVRAVLLNPANEAMGVRCEALLYMASRAQLVGEVIQPALERGELVLADRFVSSTLAYQGAAGGLAAQEIEALARVAVGACTPDLTVIFDVDEQTSAARNSGAPDRVERKGLAYHRKVREGFLAQAHDDPARHIVIDAAPDADAIFARLLAALEAHAT